MIRSRGDAVAIIGLAVMTVAYFWWKSFYTQVWALLGAKGPLPTECLYQGSGPCQIVKTAAGLAGQTPYEPLLFQAGAAAFVVGALMAVASWFGGSRHDDAFILPSKPSRKEPHF